VHILHCSLHFHIICKEKRNMFKNKDMCLPEEVISMMCSFQRMLDAMMDRLEREEGGVLMDVEGSQNPTSNHVHREMEKVKFLEFWGSTNGQEIEAWLENMEMCFSLRITPLISSVHMGIF
jgi:hypothetical protein